MEDGLIFNIQRFSLHDGPGIRTTVFFKGCPLQCRWCHNPEGLSTCRRLYYVKERCISCGMCMQVCPNNVHNFVNSKHTIDRIKCNLCGCCVNVCPTRALTFDGRKISVDDVMRVVLYDKIFYDVSEGGVTLSGGEPFQQPDFAANLLEACRCKGISTAVDTSGYTSWDNIKKSLDNIDLVLLDIKTMQSTLHKQYTGVFNELILENARRIAEEGISMIIRTPVISGVNDSPKDIRLIAEFAATLKTVKYLELLPYHRFGESKCEMLGLKKEVFQPVSSVKLQTLYEAAFDIDIPVKIKNYCSKEVC